MVNERSVRIVGIINLILVVVTNVLILWTWYNSFTADGDMFLGLLLIPLLIVTIYYLSLLRWGIRLAKGNNETKDKLIQSFVLFLMNVVPATLIYILTM